MANNGHSDDSGGATSEAVPRAPAAVHDASLPLELLQTLLGRLDKTHTSSYEPTIMALLDELQAASTTIRILLGPISPLLLPPHALSVRLKTTSVLLSALDEPPDVFLPFAGLSSILRSLHLLHIPVQKQSPPEEVLLLAEKLLDLVARVVGVQKLEISCEGAGTLAQELAFWAYLPREVAEKAKRPPVTGLARPNPLANAFVPNGKRSVVSTANDVPTVLSKRQETFARAQSTALQALKLSFSSRHIASLLRSHWTLLLPDSPHPTSKVSLLDLVESGPSATRIAAAQVLAAMLTGSKSYLAVADDRNPRASYTSLSSKLAATITELHLRLARILDNIRLENDATLIHELLQLAGTLARSTPYTRFQKQIEHELVQSILPYIDISQRTFSVFYALKAVQAIYMSIQERSSRAVDVRQVFTVVHVYLLRDKDYIINREEWSMIVLLADAAVLDQVSSLLRKIDETIKGVRPLDQQPMIAFIRSILPRIDNYQVGPDEDSFPTSLSSSRLNDQLHNIVTPLAALESEEGKLAACEVLSVPAIARTCRGDSASFWLSMLDLAQEASGGEVELARPNLLRDAACRALGVLLREAGSPSDLVVFSRVVRLLVANCTTNDGEDVGTSTSWALANATDAFSSNGTTEDTTALVECAMLLVQKYDVDDHLIAAMRIIGNVYRFTTPDEGTVPTMLICLCKTSHKVQWNAAVAIGHALESGRLNADDSTTILYGLAVQLGRSDAFKTRIQIAEAITRAKDEAFESGEALDDVRSSVLQAIDGNRKRREMTPAMKRAHSTHGEQLRQALDQCYLRLMTFDEFPE